MAEWVLGGNGCNLLFEFCCGWSWRQHFNTVALLAAIAEPRCEGVLKRLRTKDKRVDLCCNRLVCRWTGWNGFVLKRLGG